MRWFMGPFFEVFKVSISGLRDPPIQSTSVSRILLSALIPSRRLDIHASGILLDIDLVVYDKSTNRLNQYYLAFPTQF